MQATVEEALLDTDQQETLLRRAQGGGGLQLRWSYQPLVVSLAGTGECLRVINQPGSARSSDAAAGALRAVEPRVQRYFRNALVRGDTDFDRANVYQEVIDQKAYFAIGARVYPNRAALVQALPESAWQPFFLRRPNQPAEPSATRKYSSARSRVLAAGIRISGCLNQRCFRNLALKEGECQRPVQVVVVRK